MTYLSNLANDSAPMVCRCSSTVAVGPLRLQPRLCLQEFCQNHSRTSRSFRKLGSKSDSNVTDPSIHLQTQNVGGGSPSLSFANSFKASNRLRSVRFRFEARSFVLCRGVVVPDPIKGGGVSSDVRMGLLSSATWHIGKDEAGGLRRKEGVQVKVLNL